MHSVNERTNEHTHFKSISRAKKNQRRKRNGNNWNENPLSVWRRMTDSYRKGEIKHEICLMHLSLYICSFEPMRSSLLRFVIFFFFFLFIFFPLFSNWLIRSNDVWYFEYVNNWRKLSIWNLNINSKWHSTWQLYNATYTTQQLCNLITLDCAVEIKWREKNKLDEINTQYEPLRCEHITMGTKKLFLQLRIIKWSV